MQQNVDESEMKITTNGGGFIIIITGLFII